MSSSKEYFKRLRSGEVLPAFRDDLRVNQYMKDEERQKRLDIRADILANILAAYPTTPTAKLAKEYGLTNEYISQLAMQHGVHKVGYKGNRTAANKVEKVDSEGKVVAVYDSANKAAKAEGVPYSSIRCRIEGRVTTPLNGFTFRIKKQFSKPQPHIDEDLTADFDDEDFDFDF